MTAAKSKIADELRELHYKLTDGIETDYAIRTKRFKCLVNAADLLEEQNE